MPPTEAARLLRRRAGLGRIRPSRLHGRSRLLRRSRLRRRRRKRRLLRLLWRCRLRWRRALRCGRRGWIWARTDIDAPRRRRGRLRRSARHFRFRLRFVFGCFLRSRVGRSGIGSLIGRRLIALDQILRHAGAGARHAVGEYRLPVAFQLGLGVEHVVGEQRRRIELAAWRATGAREHKGCRRTGPNQQR